MAAAVVLIAAAVFVADRSPGVKRVAFPAGVTEIHSEMMINAGTEVFGVAGRTVLRAAPDFQGRAMLVVRGDGVRLHDFTIDGNRDALEVRTELPAYDTPFARFTRGNGVLAEGVADLRIENISFRKVAGFAVLVSRSRRVTIDRVRVAESGSR